MEWKLAEAKQRLSEVVRRAADEPQTILNRDRPVAAVIAIEGLEDFLEWRAARRAQSLKDSLGEIRSICREEAIAYEAPLRVDRPNPLAGPGTGGRRAPRRHKRSQ